MASNGRFREMHRFVGKIAERLHTSATAAASSQPRFSGGLGDTAVFGDPSCVFGDSGGVDGGGGASSGRH